MTPVRVLGACGLMASALAACSCFLGVPILLGMSGAVMVAGNLYALIRS